MPGLERGGHVDQPLVAAPAEKEALVAQLLAIAAVDQHVDVLKQLRLLLVLEQLFEVVTRVAPDVLLAALLDRLGQLGETLGLEHRVATTEGDVREVVREHFVQDLFGRYPMASADVPRLGIVASRAMVRASGGVDGGPEAGTIYCCLFDNVDDGEHGL